MNGSPLYTGDAGSGGSEIRRWILENDWLGAIVALPEQLFYNTGVATYIWVLTDRKVPRRRGKVQLIDASSYWIPMRRSLGDKRREISPAQIREITKLYSAFTEDEHLKIFDTSVFGYRKITVERPLRLNFQASPERIARLREEKVFANLAEPKKTRKKATEVQPLLLEDPAVAAGRQEQEKILAMLSTVPDALFKDCSEFESLLNRAVKASNLKLAAPIRKAILSALSERDETAEICQNKDGTPEPDTQLRDTENVPLTEDIQTFFEREVKPHVPDAWINTSIRDEKDGEVDKVGYEVNFNRYFYQYQPPRPLGEIESDIKTLEREILEMLREVAG